MLSKSLRSATLLTLVVLSMHALGCSRPEPDPSRKDLGVYRISFRQTAPQPAYNRLRWVNSPDILPDRTVPVTSAPAIHPIFHFKATNISLTEIAKVLAEASRYSGFCDGSNCSKTVNVNSLGSIDELAVLISKKAECSIVVDHDAREVRVESEG